MTNKADLQRVYFHNYQKHSRVNNPTYVSSFVNDSLTLFTPQRASKAEGITTEYKSHFQPFADKINIIAPSQSHNYARYSKQAFEKSRSYLSQYGTNSLSQNLAPPNKKY